MATVTIRDDLVALLRDGDEPVDQVAQEMIVLELYRRRTISSGRASDRSRVLRGERLFQSCRQILFYCRDSFQRPTVMVCYGPTGTLKVGHKA